MTYIKLEDALHIIYADPYTSDKLYQEINSLPSIDPQGIIKEMIEEMRNKEYMYDLDMVKIDALQELISKLPK